MVYCNQQENKWYIVTFENRDVVAWF